MPGGALGSGHSRCPGSVQSQKRNLRYGPHWKYHRPPTRGSYPIHQRGGHTGHSAPPSVPRQYGGFGPIPKAPFDFLPKLGRLAVTKIYGGVNCRLKVKIFEKYPSITNIYFILHCYLPDFLFNIFHATSLY